MAVRIVAGAAGRLSFQEALRSLQRFDDERGLTKPAVPVESFSRKLAEGNALIAHEEITSAGIVDFAVRSGNAKRRLHVALRADGNEIAITDLGEIHRRIERPFVVGVSVVHRGDVALGWTMAHLAVDAWLAEFAMGGRWVAGIEFVQLAGVADRAIRLVGGGGIGIFPMEEVGAWASGIVDDLPEVHPLLGGGVVLNRKNLDFAIGQFRGVGLLPLRSDGVVDGVGVPPAVRLFDGE